MPGSPSLTFRTPAGCPAKRELMPNNARNAEMLRAQIKRRGSLARLAWRKLTRKEPAALPPITSLPSMR